MVALGMARPAVEAAAEAVAPKAEEEAGTRVGAKPVSLEVVWPEVAVVVLEAAMERARAGGAVGDTVTRVMDSLDAAGEKAVEAVAVELMVVASLAAKMLAVSRAAREVAAASVAVVREEVMWAVVMVMVSGGATALAAVATAAAVGKEEEGEGEEAGVACTAMVARPAVVAAGGNCTGMAARLAVEMGLARLMTLAVASVAAAASAVAVAAVAVATATAGGAGKGRSPCTQRRRTR